MVILGLAPAAHGANRTGRLFTGDRSGDFLYASLYRTRFANRPHSVAIGDGLELRGALITATVRCAPPANRPTSEEIATCSRWLRPDLERPEISVVVALGVVAHSQALRMAPELGWEVPRPRPRFAHGAEVPLGGGPVLLSSYHPSQQNTFTGKLTAGMLDTVFSRARVIAGI